MTTELIDTAELARRTGVSRITWARRRCQGGKLTPPYLKIGRSVKYRWSDVEAWLARCERSSTSEGDSFVTP